MDQLIQKQFTIRAFKAEENHDLCDKFIEGHKRVLLSVGVEEVSSSSNSWKYEPNVYVIICESNDGEKVYGGVRVHVYNDQYVLPMVEATKEFDPSVADHIKNFSPAGTGEMCGLWNSIEVAGMGIGAVYLIRSAIAILTEINLRSLWALCSPFSARIAKNYSFLKYPHVGNYGTFYYPKIDLLATVCMVDDSESLKDGNREEVKKIFDLRRNLNVEKEENNRGRDLRINYQLGIDV